MRTLKRPMFNKGGSTNEGIMTGLVDRRKYANGIGPVNSNLDTFYQSPDSEILEKFQSLGLGNPYRDQTDMFGRITRPADNNIIDKLVEAAPIVQEQKAAKEATEKVSELRPYQKYFSGKLDADFSAPKKTTGEISELGDQTISQVVADRRDRLSAKAKRYAELLSPNAIKRAMIEGAAAASESFGKSTGDTKKDVADAITAFAKTSGGASDILDKAKLLALEEEMKINIARASAKPNTTESLIALGKSKQPGESDADFKERQGIFKVLSKDRDTKSTMIISLADNYPGSPDAVKRGTGDYYQLQATSANAETYGGTLPTARKGEVADFAKMEKGKEYYNYFDGNFYSLNEEGKQVQIKKPAYLK